MEQISKAGQDALERPVTYGDVFGAPGPIRKEPITPEDAGLMQSAETLTLGKTQKDGAASVMQAAAEENVKAGLLNKETHSAVAEEGVAVVETIIPGARSFGLSVLIFQTTRKHGSVVVRNLNGFVYLLVCLAPFDSWSAGPGSIVRCP